jgi:hypothetical protein
MSVAIVMVGVFKGYNEKLVLATNDFDIGLLVSIVDVPDGFGTCR